MREREIGKDHLKPKLVWSRRNEMSFFFFFVFFQAEIEKGVRAEIVVNMLEAHEKPPQERERVCV